MKRGRKRIWEASRASRKMVQKGGEGNNIIPVGGRHLLQLKSPANIPDLTLPTSGPLFSSMYASNMRSSSFMISLLKD